MADLTPFVLLPTPWSRFRGGRSGAWMLHPRPPASLDPFMMVDHFVMDEPTFMPHPHAGFSAVTYLFEDSEGGIANRDSLGHALHIAPGGLLWTQAGSGVLHEELPVQRGLGTHGLQIFVNSAIAHKDKPAQVFERRAEDIVAVPVQGAWPRTSRRTPRWPCWTSSCPRMRL
jgi:redox-sensitive bicupin YhaK (pirin superfamily)